MQALKKRWGVKITEDMLRKHLKSTPTDFVNAYKEVTWHVMLYAECYQCSNCFLHNTTFVMSLMLSLQLIENLVKFVRMDTEDQQVLSDKDIVGKITRKFSNERDKLEKRLAKEAMHQLAELQAQVAAGASANQSGQSTYHLSY
jgi:hypothetical protein